MIAPKILVAANPTAKRIAAVRMAPRMPVRIAERMEHKLQPRIQASPKKGVFVSKIARYTTAVPRTAQKNAGATVMTAAKLRNAATVPMIKLAINANARQVKRHVQEQFKLVI
jgi:hypothetical protein